jgi:hypothetical protein
MAMPSASRTKLSGVCTGSAGTSEVDQLRQTDAEQQAEKAAERREGDGLAEKEPRMVRRGAPSATSRPISPVRSVTAMVMMVTMPTPPTSSEMLPSAPTAMVSTSRMLDSVRSMSSCVVMVKSSRPWRAISVLDGARDDGGGTPSSAARSISSGPSRLYSSERAGGRDVGGVVEVDAEELALGFHDADDAKLQAADAQALRRADFRCRTVRSLSLAPSTTKARAAFGVVGGRNWPLRTVDLNTLGIRR